MKKICEYSVIAIFFILSLIYTEKIINVAKEKDPIMQNIVKNMDKYKISSVNASIIGDTITPGVRGCIIDIDKSYEHMKKINEYQDKLLKYRNLIPEITINNVYNKYIINGNKHKRQVSIIINLNDNISDTNNITNDINEKINIFVSSNLIDDKLLKIDKEYIKIYNGGNSNNYDDITIEWMNDVISDNYNESKYCINKNRNDDNLLICNRNKMYTISPTIIVNNSNLYEVKSLVQNGSIIYFDGSNILQISNIIKYVKTKGYKIVFLDELLDESICE